MATAIGDLVVNLTARTSQFQNKIGGARGMLGGFVKSVGSAITRLGALGVALAGAAGVGSLSLLVKNSLQTIDATAKLSDRIGASTEFLSAMGFAAEQTGGSVAGFNKSIEKFGVNIGKGQQGVMTQVRAFDQLGLKAEQLAGMSLDDAFTLTAERLSGLTTQTEKMQVATDLFGRSGVELVNLLDSGAGGIEAFRREAEELGIAFNRVDAAKVEAANDAMNRVKRSIGGAANELTVALAPALESVAGWVTSTLVPAFRSMAGVINDVLFVFENFGDTASLTLLNIVHAGLTAFPQLEQPIEIVAAKFIATWAGVKAFFSSIIDNMIGGLKEFGNVAEAISAGVSAAFQAIKSGNITGAASAFGDAFIKKLASQTNVDAPNAFKQFGEAFDAAERDALKLFKAGGGLTAGIDRERQKILDRLADRQGERDKAQQASAATPKTSAAAGNDTPPNGEGQEPKFASALELGTSEAFDAISRAIGGGPQSEAKKQTAALNKLQQQSEEAGEDLAAIRQNTRPNSDRPIVIA